MQLSSLLWTSNGLRVIAGLAPAIHPVRSNPSCEENGPAGDQAGSTRGQAQRFDSPAGRSYKRIGTAGASFLSRHTPLDLSEHLPHLINRVGSALVARFSADALAGAHLSVASWRVLAVLSNNDGLRQTDLAELTSIDASTLSRLIGRLVHDGLVRRTRSKTNSREVAVVLTPKAETLLGKLVPVAL